MYDLIISGGRLIDTANHVDANLDIAVQNGRIAAIGNLRGTAASQAVDAADCIVSPGLIDTHAHLASLAPFGIPAEAGCFPAGVTAVLEAGSAGCATYEFCRSQVLASRVRTRAFLNISTAGLATLGSSPEVIDPAAIDEKGIRRLFDRYPNELIGLKVRIGRETARDLGIEPLRATVRLARSLGVPVMVHSTNPPVPMAEILNLLGPGDILTHYLHNHGPNLLNDDDSLIREAWLARERGVIFDVGDASWHMSYRVAEAALREGFLPDTIGSDLTINGLYNRNRAFSFPFVLSKYLNLGLRLEEILACCTANAARLLGLAGQIGHLAVGAPADIAVLRETRQTTVFFDGNNVPLTGDRLLRVMLTVRDGAIVWRDLGI